MTTSQTNSGANRTESTEDPPNPVVGKSAESKKKKRKKMNNNNSKITINVRSQQDDVIKGVVIPSGITAKMTEDYRQIVIVLSSYASAKGYKKWPGAIVYMTRP